MIGPIVLGMVCGLLAAPCIAWLLIVALPG